MHRAMRRAIAAAAAVLLMSGAAALAESYPYGTTTTAKVNLRKSASSSSVVLVRVPKGDEVTVMGKSGNYYRVEYNGVTGYILKGYLNEPSQVVEDTTAPDSAAAYPYQTSARSEGSLRQTANAGAKRLTTIPAGARLTVCNVEGSYAQVIYSGMIGYVDKSCVTLLLGEDVQATTAPQPVSPSENAAGYEVLKIGSTGSAVKALEEAMRELGFFVGTPDTTFDAATNTAVIALQEKNSYPATGIVDANFQAFLYSGSPKNSRGTATKINTLAPVAGVTIRKNSTGDLVGQVQARLQELGYYKGYITYVCDTATMEAVKAFQKASGLKADGMCGSDTQKLLFASSSDEIGTIPQPMATPSPEPTFQVPASTVDKGDSGVDALLVQQRLQELGYYSGKLDGKFGSGSVNALKAFQRKNALKDDGVAGTETKAVLFSVHAVPAVEPTASPTPSPKPVPTPSPSPTYPVITKDNVVVIRTGTTGAAVLNLQRRLTELKYYTAAMDSVCRAADVTAIRLFQQKNGLEVDGIAGYDTQRVLYSSAAVANTTTSGNVGITYATLRMGDSGAAVTRLQNRLIQLGYLSDRADGKYGAKTADAVIRFQRASGLRRDGIAGQQTQTLLYAATPNTPAPTPTASPAPQLDFITTASTLRRGDRSEAVAQLQRRLISFGYLTGKADGIFGIQTYNALRSFQTANGLRVDGVAGQATIGALNQLGNLQPTATQPPQGGNDTPTVTNAPNPAQVIYANWYNDVRPVARIYQYATVYDYETGASWQVHMFSFGNHAEAEPITAADTAAMEADFGGNTWNPKPVWVIFGNGQVYMASTHSMPHEVQHITDNRFPGHLCIHFPRTASQVAAIGSYATSHQSTVDQGWQKTQSMIK